MNCVFTALPYYVRYCFILNLIHYFIPVFYYRNILAFVSVEELHAQVIFSQAEAVPDSRYLTNIAFVVKNVHCEPYL